MTHGPGTPADEPETARLNAGAQPGATAQRNDAIPALTPLSARVAAPTKLELPDAGEGLSWRRLSRADLPALAELAHAAAAVDHSHWLVSVEELIASFERPTFAPELDTAVAVDAVGRIVAYGEATISSAQLNLVRVYLSGWVHPDRRREGIGASLLAWQEGRGRQMLAASSAALPGWLITDAEALAVAHRALLDAAGFAPARWWLAMNRDLSEAIPEVKLGPGLRIARFRPEDSEGTRQAMNDSFRDHWASQPTTQEDWNTNTLLSSFRQDLSCVVFGTLHDGTEEIAGALTVSVNAEEWQQLGFSFGYIEQLGVRRAWRGRGIAPAMLAHTLRVLRDAGFERAVLDVDVESPTGAVGLYDRLGFTELSRSLTQTKTF